jgi:hypothetical protein
VSSFLWQTKYYHIILNKLYSDIVQSYCLTFCTKFHHSLSHLSHLSLIITLMPSQRPHGDDSAGRGSSPCKTYATWTQSRRSVALPQQQSRESSFSLTGRERFCAVPNPSVLGSRVQFSALGMGARNEVQILTGLARHKGCSHL